MTPRKSFPLRIEPGLHQALEAWAQQEMRSVNGQIEYLLREAVRRRTGERPGGDRTSADRTSGDRTSADRASADRTSGDRTDGARAGEERAADQAGPPANAKPEPGPSAGPE